MAACHHLGPLPCQKKTILSEVCPKRIIRIDEVSARTGLCASSIYNLIGAGEFPRQIKLTGRAVGWIEAEIDGWIAQKAAQRPSPPAI